jgi:hypothetical protein
MEILLNKEGVKMNEFQDKIDKAVKNLGFEAMEVGGKKLYFYKGNYYKFSYINDFKAYVIEYASSYEEALNNVFEDGDLYTIDMGENLLIEKITTDLIKYYI